MARQPADLESILLRPGQARGVRPEAVTPPAASGGQEPANDQAPQSGAGQGAQASIQSQLPALPVRQAKEETTTLSVRVPVEIFAALNLFALDSGVPKQDIVAWVLNAGLTGQFGDWRKHLDENYPRWRSLIQR